MRLVSEVLGALAAGALVLVIARQFVPTVQGGVGAVVLVPLIVAALVATPALEEAAKTLLDQRRENSPLTAEEARLKPGSSIGMNVAFFAWAQSHFAEDDTFHMEIGRIPDEVYVGDVGVRQAAILQWGLFQLAPHLAVEQSPLARDVRAGEGRRADWIVFYEKDPRDYPAGLTDVITYAPEFAIARSRHAG